MSPGPIRRLSNHSRVANLDAGGKLSGLKNPLKRSAHGPGFMLNQVLTEHDPGNVTRRPLTAMDLSLPPFKSTRSEESVTAGEKTPEGRLGPFACQPVDEETLSDVEGMPTRVQWKSIVEAYLASLHPSKRHKSLISQEVYKMIFQTLRDPDATRLGTPQFRFWARKMFQLVGAPNNILVITNGGRPVAIKEHIYDILCMCHAECGHGGRDKTCKILREYYTWVPKELISNFVKECPTCAPRKLAASKSKERKSEAGPAVLEDRLPAAPRFSVERLQDFGQLPSPASNESHQLKLHPLSGFAPSIPSQFGRDNGVEKCFIPVNFPATPSSCKSNVLPPLNCSTGYESDIPPRNIHGQVPLPPLMQYLSQPFDARDSLQSPKNGDAPATHQDIPIDPALLLVSTHTTSSSPQCDCNEPRCSKCTTSSREPHTNALHLQLRPPSSQRSSYADEPPLVGSSATQSGNLEGDAMTPVWEFPSVASVYGGEADSSALLSASTVSIGLPTPLPSGQISPMGDGCDAALELYSPDTPPNVIFEGILRQYGFGNGLSVSSASGIKNDGRVKSIPSLPYAPSPPLHSPRPVRAEDTKAVLELAVTTTENIDDHADEQDV